MTVYWIPKSIEEIDNMIPTLKEGNYNFETINSEEKTSDNGNSMIALTHKIWDEEGNSHIIFDNIVLASDKMNKKGQQFCERKHRHYWESVGKVDIYESGKASVLNYRGNKGVLSLQTKKDDKYGEQLKVFDYILLLNKKQTNISSKKDQGLEDELPF